MNHHFLHNGGLYDVTYVQVQPRSSFVKRDQKEHTTCPVCEKERDYVYHGPFYTVEDVEEFVLGALKMDQQRKNTMEPFKMMQAVMMSIKRNI